MTNNKLPVFGSELPFEFNGERVRALSPQEHQAAVDAHRAYEHLPLTVTPAEQRELGPLMGMEIEDEPLDAARQILAHLCEAADNPDPTVGIRAMQEAHRAHTVLCAAGYPFNEFREQCEEGLRRVRRFARQELVRRLLAGTIEDESATRALMVLREMSTSAEWPTVEADLAEIEAVLCRRQ